MNLEIINTLDEVIINRRTTKVQKMNGTIIDQKIINELLLLADAAPTHGRTEPWRFFIYSEDSLGRLCNDHSNMYWEHTAEETRNASTRDNIRNFAQHASHLIIAVMKRTPLSKIPKLEEYAATSAAVQNLLLGASSRGIASIWNTGGMALKQPMKDYLQLQEEDEVVGFVYLGYADESIHSTPVRKIPISEKVNFVN